MHHYKLEFKFSFKFNTKGGSYLLSSFLICSNQFFNFIKSLKTKDLFFIKRITTADGLFLKPWKDIKQSLTNKRGRIPAWYNYLYENIVLNRNNLCLNFEDQPNTKRIKNVWIAYWCPRTNEIIFGRVIEKNHFYNHHQTIIFEHFTHILDSHPSNNNFNTLIMPYIYY